MFICLYIDFWWASSKIQQHYVRLHPVAEEQKDKKGKGCCFYILGRTRRSVRVMDFWIFLDERNWKNNYEKHHMGSSDIDVTPLHHKTNKWEKLISAT